MADVEIKYNNATIASLNDSGTEVLETNGTFLTDDITVEYTKSGGGGVETSLITNTNPTCKFYYEDASCNIHYVENRPDDVLNDQSPVGSIVVGRCTSNLTSMISVTNTTIYEIIDLGSRVSPRYLVIYQVAAS